MKLIVSLGSLSAFGNRAERRDANLKVESKAGKAFLSLEVRAAQVRRRQKRASERKADAEAEQAEHQR